jgi:hypothetical protein
MTRAGPCVIIDVRTSEEFSRGHLEGAENIDFFLPDFKEWLRSKDRQVSYVVYAGKVTGEKRKWNSCGGAGFTTLSIYPAGLRTGSLWDCRWNGTPVAISCSLQSHRTNIHDPAAGMALTDLK